MGWNFGRTDFKKDASKAKLDARADGDVRVAVRRPKPLKIYEKYIQSKNFANKKNSASKNKILRIVRNAFQQIFAAKSPANTVAGPAHDCADIDIQTARKNSNGRKIARMAPIWTKI